MIYHLSLTSKSGTGKHEQPLLLMDQRRENMIYTRVQRSALVRLSELHSAHRHEAKIEK